MTHEVLQGARWHLHEGESYAWLRSLPDASVDAVISDPPYSSGGFTRGDRTVSTVAKYEQTGNVHVHREDFAGDNRDQRSFLGWCTLWLSEALRVAKPGAPIAVFSDWRQLPTMTDAIQSGGWIWRGILPWDKTEGVRPQMGRPRAQAEYLVLGSAAIATDELAEFVVWGSAGSMPPREDVGVLSGVIRYVVPKDDKHHLVGKPTAVMQCAARLCPPGGIVLDPFAGSGTTGVGALLEGRRFLGAEVMSSHASIARERLQAAACLASLAPTRAGTLALFGEAASPTRGDLP
jgi:site-specific DNA-methyltransferase (adenine-specific)